MSGENSKLTAVWVGFHEEGLSALEALCEKGVDIKGVITLSREKLERKSGHADYRSVAESKGIPTYEIENLNVDGLEILTRLRPDVLFVIGWSQILSEDVLSVPRIAALGAHASLLPHNRGSAPVNWALIRGETRGGNTLMKLAPGVDEGDIVLQREFPITLFDSCASIYKSVADSNRQMIIEVVDMIKEGRFHARPQPETDEPILPRRRPSDGEIDWSWSSGRVYDFVRALTRPYPGAFSHVDGRKCVVWKASLNVPDLKENSGKVGTIVSHQVGFDDVHMGLWVKCGYGSLLVHEVQFEDDSRVLAGRSLLDWFGSDISRFD